LSASADPNDFLTPCPLTTDAPSTKRGETFVIEADHWAGFVAGRTQ
jgi:hypothetical protein